MQGFAYVEFESSQGLQRAVDMTGVEIGGKNLKITVSHQPIAGGGRGGSRGGGRGMFLFFQRWSGAQKLFGFGVKLLERHAPRRT